MALAVLMYHEIGGANRYDVSPDVFLRQMRHIRDEGYEAVTPEQLPLIGGSLDTRRAVMITFDDGFASDLTAAAGIMAPMGLAGVSFIATDFVGRPGYLSWTQVNELVRAGFSVQSHSHTHPLLGAMPVDRIMEECVTSKEMIERNTGRPVCALSLPGGSDSRAVRRAVSDAGYRYLFLSRPGINTARIAGRGALRRITVTGGMPFERWCALLSGDGLLHRSAAVSYGLRKAAKAIIGAHRYQRLWRIVAK